MFTFIFLERQKNVPKNLFYILICVSLAANIFDAYCFSGKSQPKRIMSNFKLFGYDQQSNYDPSYLQRLVERKKIEVNSLLKKHQDVDDPLVMRMSYMASQCKFNVTRSIKLGLGEKDGK